MLQCVLSECFYLSDNVPHQTAKPLPRSEDSTPCRAESAHSRLRLHFISLDLFIPVSISKAKKHHASGAAPAAMTTACVSAALTTCSLCAPSVAKQNRRGGKECFLLHVNFKAVGRAGNSCVSYH